MFSLFWLGSLTFSDDDGLRPSRNERYVLYLIKYEEKISRFSNTANVDRKTVYSIGIWTRAFGNRVTGNAMLIWSNLSAQCLNSISDFFNSILREIISILSSEKHEMLN